METKEYECWPENIDAAGAEEWEDIDKVVDNETTMAFLWCYLFDYSFF